MSKQKKCDQKLTCRGGHRPGAGRPRGTKFGEATGSIRLPLSAINYLRSYRDNYGEIRQGIAQSDLSVDLAEVRLYELGYFGQWLVEELSTSKKVVDIESYRKYSSVAATPETMGVTDDSYEEIKIGDYLIENPHNSYVLDVVGDSMVDMEIYDGTFLIVEEYNQPHEKLKGGEIVVVSLGSSFSMMVKTYHRDENGRVFLISANSRYKPIAIEEHDQLLIQGLVKKVINKPELMSLSLRQRYMGLSE
jgi:DNA polymerase V